MVNLLDAQLREWQLRSDIACVWLQGAGQKAFCAGGDVRRLYHAVQNNVEDVAQHAENFFQMEYQLDYLIHNFSKPLICWGHGVVMGGGLGLLAGAHYKVVTPASRLAMPEISIGFFPDVGASWFLNKLPAGVGLFLALTGMEFNSDDALYIGLADYCIDQTEKDLLMDMLQACDWSDHSGKNNNRVESVLAECSIKAESNSFFQQHYDVISPLAELESIQDVWNTLGCLSTKDKRFQTAIAQFQKGSPLSTAIIFKQFQMTRELDLKAVFQSELTLAVNMLKSADLLEGVRALLVDKDSKPNWKYKSLGDIDEQELEDFFQQPWEDNPLASL